MESIRRAASAALQDILETIDSSQCTSSATSLTITSDRSGPLTSTQTVPAVDAAKSKEDYKEVAMVTGGSNSVDQETQVARNSENRADDQGLSKSLEARDANNQLDKHLWSLSLCHEEERWVRLRNQMVELPLFKKYLSRMKEDSSWSIDEAFTSFCLDQIEAILAKSKPSAPSQPKRGTRRKGQPKKYDRRQTKAADNNPARRVRKRQCRDNSLKYEDLEDILSEDEDEDFLAMDDNPKDLDYQPVPMIPYPKRRKRLPRSSTMGQVPAGIPTTRQPDRKSSERKSPKRAPRNPQKSPLTQPSEVLQEPIRFPHGPERPVRRKRGRPKKASTEVKMKVPKPRVKAEKPRHYIRMEVRLQRLPKMYECKTCFEQFPDVEEMKKHFQEVHQQSVPTQNGRNLPVEEDKHNQGSSSFFPQDVGQIATLLRQCPKCKKFVENMTVHKREHQERNFICEECGKGFTENQILQKHKKVHEMDRTGHRYKCELCDKSYRFAQNLRSHMLYHGGEKTFICDHCGKSFYTSNRLIIHSAIHMKEKPFKCRECGRGFSQKTNMQKHERVHTGVKPYQCELCRESFNHKVSLKNHKKKHHGIDWWKEVGRPKPVTTRRSKDRGSLEATTGQNTPNTYHLGKQQHITTQLTSRDMAHHSETNQWKDHQQLVQQVDSITSETAWHREGENIPSEPQTQVADEAVRLQALHQAGNQWKTSLDRQGQVEGDQGMGAFFYPSTYLQGYQSGYSGMPVIPMNTDTSIHPVTRL